ncbi:hypothetical protein POX_h09550 [Penicillium oxalicum]|uniref:Uncharacterized protein n=1 Tax=Penicillium oxalicum (strain 114-2 / CGMCC 5302) TaxID=933388 RepID=S7ZLR3_PENO1|nr:hypothetical protein POX_h09550 [Penicillium oxalicum]EPS31254.1 hypothetical protein PDE_06209 [Penicillium oxalicum 114-2]KAI2785791.1 hypothetical protein POX_h09550 [Penicillium oxalicum]
MQFFNPVFVLMALVTSQAIAAPAAEVTDLEARAKNCVTVKICHGYNWEGGCYKECLEIGKPHNIRKEYRKNVGSFKIGEKGYECTAGSATEASVVMHYPGKKRLEDRAINHLDGYQCMKMKN